MIPAIFQAKAATGWPRAPTWRPRPATPAGCRGRSSASPGRSAPSAACFVNLGLRQSFLSNGTADAAYMGFIALLRRLRDRHLDRVPAAVAQAPRGRLSPSMEVAVSLSRRPAWAAPAGSPTRPAVAPARTPRQRPAARAAAPRRRRALPVRVRHELVHRLPLVRGGLRRAERAARRARCGGGSARSRAATTRRPAGSTCRCRATTASTRRA